MRKYKINYSKKLLFKVVVMLRIGIVALYSGSSGRKSYYNQQEVGMAKGFATYGYECFVFYPDGINPCEELEIINKKVTVVHCPGKKIGVHGKFDWNILTKYRLDYVQSNTDTQYFASDCIRFCEKNDIPVYHYIGTTKSDSDSCFKRWIMHLLYKRNIVCLKKHKCFSKTRAVADELKRLGVDSEVVPVGLDLDCIPEMKEDKEQAREFLKLPKDKKILLFVGRIDEYKRPLDFLKIIKRLNDNYYAVMIGSGKLNDKLQQSIDNDNLSSKLRWIKSVPNQDIHMYYKASDYFINLNDHEIFGMSILEAMYQGITVIAMHAPGPDTIIENGKSGYLVKNDLEIKELLNRGVVCDTNLVRNHIFNNFCWKKSVDKIIKLLE